MQFWILQSLCFVTLTFKVISGQDCPEGYEASEVDGNCYSFNSSQMSWDQARSSCFESGGFLFEPRTDSDLKVLERLVSTSRKRLNSQSMNSEFWLGASFLDDNLVFDSNWDAATKIEFTSKTNSKKDAALYKTPSGFVSGLKAWKKHFYCAYKPFWPCWTCPWYYGQCCCENSYTPTCYQFGRLFLEESLPMTMSLTACQESCKKTSACKFFTWSQSTQRCGLRFYNPGGVITSPGQRSGTETKILQPNEVYVGRTEHLNNPYQCQAACQKDPKCQSMTFNYPWSGNPNTCVFNYGPTILRPFIGFGSGVVSSPKFCPNDCLRREKTLPNYDFNGQEYSQLF